MRNWEEFKNSEQENDVQIKKKNNFFIRRMQIRTVTMRVIMK